MKIEGKKILHTDVLIIGGGTAGCYAAMTIREQSDYSIIIAEKANIKRSGCLAAGVNALNAYITKGHVPQDYVDYATKDADGIVRPDLLLTMSGMEESEYIIAINKDKYAPIFNAADLGIVGDVHKIVPILTEKLRK